MPTAQVVTITPKDNKLEVQKLTINWACTDGGAVVGAVTARKYTGFIYRAIWIPGAGGDAPTALYDTTLKDEDGADVLGGLGADRSATLPEYKSSVDGLGIVMDSTLTFAVANAGDGKKGTFIVYILPFK